MYIHLFVIAKRRSDGKEKGKNPSLASGVLGVWGPDDSRYSGLPPKIIPDSSECHLEFQYPRLKADNEQDAFLISEVFLQ